MKYKYVKDYSQAHARSTAEKNPEGPKLAKNSRQHGRQNSHQKMMLTWLYRQDFAKFSLNRHYNKSS
ncbi:UNVERIFIED_CONTAM: hypothetical protein NCL1_28631 [Trichonephila clavipes]